MVKFINLHIMFTFVQNSIFLAKLQFLSLSPYAFVINNGVLNTEDCNTKQSSYMTK